ncbi:MAG: hypothetical protein D4R67_06475 [Bacteroidetes bacterium]|nr:MAG: hypothetical protein D4R67_06475 [Bacteroidota bacterium]
MYPSANLILKNYSCTIIMIKAGKRMTYLKLIWKINRGLTIFSMVFISLFQLLMLYLVTTFDTQAILHSVMNQLPETLKLFLNDSFFNMLTFNGAAAFGFNHPLVLALLAMVAISIPVRHISREIENGNMELMLALPFRRRSLVLQLWFSGFLILGAIIFASCISSLAAILIFHELTWNVSLHILEISVNLWLLFVLIMTVTLLIATLSRGGGSSGIVSAMVTLLFYLLFFTGQLWAAFKATLPFNIFNYYQPQNIMFGKENLLVDCMVLGSLIFLLMCASVYTFERRDIP